MLWLSLHFVCVCVCVYVCEHLCVTKYECVHGMFVRYLWPISAFALSSNPITFLRWSTRLINVLCRGFPFTQGTPHGLFTYMSYWQHIPFPLVTSGKINTLTSGVHKNTRQLCGTCISHVLILLYDSHPRHGHPAHMVTQKILESLWPL